MSPHHPAPAGDAFGHRLSTVPVSPPASSSASAAAPIQAAKRKKIGIRRSRARFARRWQAAFWSKKNLATVKLKHKTKLKFIYLNAESLGMGNPSFTSPHETVKTKGGKARRRKHSEPQLKLALDNQKLKHGDKTIDLAKYEPQWVFSTNEACGSKGENCDHEVVPDLAPGDTPFYFENPYEGTEESGGFEKSYREFAKKGEESEVESEDEENIEHVFMIDPKGMRGTDFAEDDPVPVLDLNTFIEEGGGKGMEPMKSGAPRKRWERYEDRTTWGRPTKKQTTPKSKSTAPVPTKPPTKPPTKSKKNTAKKTPKKKAVKKK